MNALLHHIHEVLAEAAHQCGFGLFDVTNDIKILRSSRLAPKYHVHVLRNMWFPSTESVEYSTFRNTLNMIAASVFHSPSWNEDYTTRLCDVIDFGASFRQSGWMRMSGCAKVCLTFM